MKYKYSVPNHVRRKVFEYALLGQEYRGWYKLANAQVIAGATILEVSPTYFGDLLALFSPRVSVKRSIRFAVEYIHRRKLGRPIDQCFLYDVMRSVRTAVMTYERDKVILGPKTSAFARAIHGDCDAIVIDSWMSQAFQVDRRVVRSDYVRIPIELTIEAVAKRYGWAPCEAQAAIWAGVILEHDRNVPHLYIEPEIDGVAPF